MSVHISILTGVQNVRFSRSINGHTLTKTLLLKLIFQDEGHLYGNCLFYILSIYYKFLLFFQFLSSSIRMHIPILTGVQNERISKNAKITYVLSIGVFEVASNCFFRNITKKKFFCICRCSCFLYK